MLRKIIILLFCYSNFYAQQNSVVDEVVDSYVNHFKYSKENFHFHFNKSSYFPGEEVWFKVFVVDNKNLKLFHQTKTAKLYFNDDKGKFIGKLTLKFHEGSASGVFKLPSNFNDCIVHYRIITNWSKNFDSEDTKQSFIKIKGCGVKRTTKGSQKIQFYHNTKHLLTNVVNVVEVKLSDKDKEVKEAILLDDLENDISFVKFNDLGLGKFYFKPEVGRKYYLIYTNSTGKVIEELPQHTLDGITLNLVNKGKEIYLTSNVSVNYLNEKDVVFYLIHRNGKIAEGALLNYKNNKSYRYIDKSTLLNGINTISLFKNKELIAEQTFFNAHKLHDLEKEITQTVRRINKDSVEFSIYKHSKDSIMDISISVLPKENKDVSQSDLFQKFHNVTFLDDEQLDSKKFLNRFQKAKDLFPIKTSKNYNWNSIIKQKKKETSHFFESGITVKGKLSGEKSAHLKVNYITKKEIGYVETDAKGLFAIKNLDVYKDEIIKIQPVLPSKKEVVFCDHITVDKDEFYYPNVNSKDNTVVIQSVMNPFFNDNDSNLLEEVEIKGKIKKEKKEKFINPIDNSTFVKTFAVSGENVNRYRTVLEYLTAQSGLIVVNKNGYVQIQSERTARQTIISGALNGGSLSTNMNVYVNTQKLREQDFEMLKEITMEQVKSIRVNKSGINSGGRDPFGYVRIYLNKKAIYKKQKPSGRKKDKSLFEFKISYGYEYEEEFRKPEYIYQEGDSEYLKYAILHWEPNVKLSKTKSWTNFKAAIPEGVTDLILSIKGITSSGNLIDIKRELILKN
ncbi:hypothetical protein [uncultured Tenacibaculum sp.]|uniref:hypothetical protein n=1 Tax=uncultured Tenacibaculum sp. TaxID=174713 RepID=UPI00261862CD|nr:hypothetical protein [uncultured Tenacibaculum sp.]